MARKIRKKVLAYAPETTYGTDAISGGSPKYLLGREFSITPMAGESQSLDYDDGTLGNSEQLVTELYVTMEFTVDFAAGADATTAAPWGELMKGCLRKTTAHTQATDGTDENIYEIDESGTGSMTFYYYQDGILHKMTGARGSFSLSAPAKGFGGLKFTFTGMHQPASADALPASPDFTAWQKPLKIGAHNSAFTLGGKALKLISLDYDQANQVVYQEYVGHEEVLITDYQPTSTIVIEAPPKADYDPFALAEAGTLQPLVFTNGSAGNQVEWKCSKVQLGRPTYADQDGTLTYSIPLTIINDSDTFATR